MIKILRTNSEHQHFKDLVVLLDAYLKEIDGEEHAFYKQYNTIDTLNNTVVAYLNNNPIGCGAFKEFNKNSVEIKRMFTLPEARSQGVASKILIALENWANEKGYTSCVLETGLRQVEAVNFYKKNNYKIIPNYGQYKNMTNSICLKKTMQTK